VALVLNGGTEYEMNSVRLSAPVHFITGLGLEGNAIMRVNGNFDFPESGTADIRKFSFTNITFTDHPDKLHNYSSTYVFNFGTAGHVDTIAFKSCEIRYKRGMLRIKTAATVSLLSISDCIIDSIGGYGVINMDNGAALVSNISIVSSTISHVEGNIIRASKTNLQPDTLYIKNVTTCFAPGGGGYFFDLDNKTCAGGITISNCLFGKPWGEGVTVRGLRSNASSVSLLLNYKTGDLNWEVDAKTFEEQYPIEASDLGKDIYAVFNDPDNNDFSIIERSAKNSAGDPRWW
jgi:hypothetical protein